MKLREYLLLQLFAEDGDAGSTEASADGNAGQTAEGDGEKSAEGKRDHAGEKKYTDADVDDIVNKKVAEWKKKQDKAVDEAKKLAEMNATQKAEYERDQLQKRVEEYEKKEAIAEMSKTARKMLTESGVTVPDDVVVMMVSDDAEATKAAVEAFSKAFSEAVEAAVKERLKGESPKRSGKTGTMTKDEIMAIKDDDLRQNKIVENRELFGI